MRWGGRRDSEIRERPGINGRDERTSVAVAVVVAVAVEREKKEEKIQFKRKLYFHRLHLLFLSLSPLLYIYM